MSKLYLGIQMKAPDEESQVRKVLSISMVLCAILLFKTMWVLILQVDNDLHSSYDAMIIAYISLSIGSLLPLCGYMGARYRSGWLLTAFWVCNGVIAVCNAMTAGLVFLALAVSASLSSKSTKPDKFTNTETSILVVYLVSSVAAFFCYTIACMWGKDLQESVTYIQYTPIIYNGEDQIVINVDNNGNYGSAKITKRSDDSKVSTKTA